MTDIRITDKNELHKLGCIVKFNDTFHVKCVAFSWSPKRHHYVWYLVTEHVHFGTKPKKINILSSGCNKIKTTFLQCHHHLDDNDATTVTTKSHRGSDETSPGREKKKIINKVRSSSHQCQPCNCVASKKKWRYNFLIPLLYYTFAHFPRAGMLDDFYFCFISGSHLVRSHFFIRPTVTCRLADERGWKKSKSVWKKRQRSLFLYQRSLIEPRSVYRQIYNTYTCIRGSTKLYSAFITLETLSLEHFIPSVLKININK